MTPWFALSACCWDYCTKGAGGVSGENFKKHKNTLRVRESRTIMHSSGEASAEPIINEDGKMYTTETIMTPNAAESILERNASNRKVRTGHIKSLADAIRRGEWKLTHQGVAIGKSGNLLDGQHRLMAIVMAGLPVKIMVSRDCDDDIFSVLDSGARRDVSDRSRLPRKVAQALSLACTVCGMGGKPSAGQVIEMSKTNFGKSVIDILSFAPSNMRFFSSAAVVCVAAASLAKYKSAGNISGQNYVTKTFKALTLADLNCLDNRPMAWVQKTMKGVGVNRDELMYGASVAFDVDGRSSSRMTFPADAKEKGRIALRDLIILVNGNINDLK